MKKSIVVSIASLLFRKLQQIKPINGISNIKATIMKRKRMIFPVLLVMLTCSGVDNLLYYSKALYVKQVTKKVFKHVSYIDIARNESYPCNGMIVIDKGEAIIFDTPVSETASKELIDWLKTAKGLKIKAVVVNHFHEDCLSGLEAFKKEGIPSYGSNKTKELASASGHPIPDYGFDETIELTVGNILTVTEFHGKGHTEDNMVSYIPSEKVLFGGCLIKAMDVNKGNISDADTSEWPRTVRKVIEAYPKVEYVIPGHGEHGGKELLDYTIELFEKDMQN